MTPAVPWRVRSAQLASRGSQEPRPGSLAGLQVARARHQGQFFTPAPLSSWLWRLLGPTLSGARPANVGARLPILDSSCGNGSLLHFAEPQQHALFGIDPDERCIAALAADARAAGFECQFECGVMEHYRPRGFALCVLNPPFSLTLSSPLLEPGPATVYGPFGPDTSALSHAYALQQGLAAAQVVAAILPRAYALSLLADQAASWPRLCAIFHLPAGLFAATELTEVAVSVALFDSRPRAPGRPVRVERIADLAVPAIQCSCALPAHVAPQLRPVGMLDDGPVITRPVTGAPRVHVGHNGRRLALGFRCGLQEARVRNALMIERLAPPEKGRRYPRGLRYVGQGQLDLEVHLAQADPLSSLQRFLERIQDTGAVVEVDPGLQRYLARRRRQLQVVTTPFRHAVRVPAGRADRTRDTLAVRARVTQVLNPRVWGSPLLRAGELFQVRAAGDGRWVLAVEGQTQELVDEELNQRFTVAESAADEDKCRTVHAGRLASFPALAQGLRARARSLGLDRILSWDYQLDDLVELSMGRSGIAAWEVGLGKARLAISLILLSGCRRGLVCTEAYLLDEMERELRQLGIDPAWWQVITRPEQLINLRRINLISYHRLRSPLHRAHPRRTYAARLRRRIGVLVADEGDLLRAKDSQQSRALWQVAAKRKYILTGTPIGNYPRDAFTLLAFTGGDATAQQPYGLHRWYLTPDLVHSTAAAIPGVDRIREAFVVTEWVTNEWADDMTRGARREVPKTKNLPGYRAAIAPHIKRRVAQEPDVARHVRLPVPVERTHLIEWDDAHLAHYLAIAEEFGDWYRQQAQQRHGRTHNLVAILSRIQAVQMAAAVPQRARGAAWRFPYPGGLTSKQRFAVARLATLSAQGHTTLAFAEYPDLLELIAQALRLQGIDPVVLHGGVSIAERAQALDTQFRAGKSPVLLATLGVAQKGLNLPQADRVLFLTRSWTAKTEQQAAGRVLRPQQTRPVEIEYLILKGGIDAYQGQMVAHKRDTTAACLDWATPTLEQVDFLHLDTLLKQFIDGIAALRGCPSHALRQRLLAA